MLSIVIGADSKQPMPDNKPGKVLATLASYAGLIITTTISLSWDLGGICFIVLAFTGAWHLLRRMKRGQHFGLRDN